MSPTRIQAYWPLIKSVVVPLNIMKIVLVMIFVIFVCVWGAIWFNKGQGVAVNAVAPMLFALVFIYFLFLGMVLPHQAMVMISNKSLRYLADFRKFYFLAAVIFSFTVCVLVMIPKIYDAYITQSAEICFQGMKECTQLKTMANVRWQDISHLALEHLVVISAYVMALFVVTYRFPVLQSFIFATFFVVPFMLTELSQWHPVQLMGLLLIGWVVFARWWLRLQPQKKHLNIFTQNIEQMMVAGTAANPSANWLATFLTPSSKPASFLGTRLIGMSDGFAVIIRVWFFFVVITLSLFVVFKWIMKDNFSSFLSYTSIYFVILMALSSSGGLVMGVCRNIKSVWLYFPGSRTQMFKFVERSSLVHSGKVMLVMPLLAIIVNEIAGFHLIALSLFIAMGVSTLLVNMLMFYLFVAIYSRDDDGKMGISGSQGIIGILVLILLMLIFLLFSKGFYISVVITLSLVLLSIFLLRRRLVNKWQQINFVRVG